MQMKQALVKTFSYISFDIFKVNVIRYCLLFQKKTQLNSLKAESVKLCKNSNVYHVKWCYNIMVSGVTLAKAKSNPLGKNIHKMTMVLTAYTAQIFILMFMFMGFMDHVKNLF